MQWLSENWIFLLVVAAMVVMHLFGHGGHGGHAGRGGHGNHRGGDRDDPARRGGHRH